MSESTMHAQATAIKPKPVMRLVEPERPPAHKRSSLVALYRGSNNYGSIGAEELFRAVTALTRIRDPAASLVAAGNRMAAAARHAEKKGEPGLSGFLAGIARDLNGRYAAGCLKTGAYMAAARVYIDMGMENEAKGAYVMQADSDRAKGRISEAEELERLIGLGALPALMIKLKYSENPQDRSRYDDLKRKAGPTPNMPGPVSSD